MATSCKNYERNELFERILPIVGEILFEKSIAFIGNRTAPQLIEALASCGVNKFDLIESTTLSSDADNSHAHQSSIEMIESLRARLGVELNYRIIRNTDDKDFPLDCGQLPSLIIANGGESVFELTESLVNKIKVPAIFFTSISDQIGLMMILLPQESLEIPREIFINCSVTAEFFSALNISSMVANYAKALLLNGSNYARRDFTELLNKGGRIFMIGHPSWPWAIKPLSSPQELIDLNRTVNSTTSIKADPDLSNDLSNRNILIIGLGSLGSVVAQRLNLLRANLILLDGETVDAMNPIRQIYRIDQIGETKARACVSILSAERNGQWLKSADSDYPTQWHWQSLEPAFNQSISAYKLTIADEEASLSALHEIVEKHHIDAAVIATGTATDRIISQQLRAAGIPQVIVSCYARARFFEAMIVMAESPCFGCLRGHLYLGSTPSLTPEQRARYISNEHDLTAEPATRIETERAADLAAQLTYQLLQTERAEWFLQAISSAETFFLGGNIADREENGEWAYGIELPGEMRLFGLQDITGRGDYLECWDCGRELPVGIRQL